MPCYVITLKNETIIDDTVVFKRYIVYDVAIGILLKGNCK